MSLLEKAIKRKGIKETDPYDWEKVVNDASQATTTTSTPLVGQMQTTPPENRLGVANIYQTEQRECATAEILGELQSEQENNANQKNAKERGNKGSNAALSNSKFGTGDKGVIQKIKEVLDAVEKENGKFLTSKALLQARECQVNLNTNRENWF